MARKIIDILELRKQINEGYFRVYTSKYRDTRCIYIEDTENGECMKIGEVEKDG